MSTDHIDILAPQNGIWIFFAFKSYVFVLQVCCFLGSVPFKHFFPYKYHLYHQKTSFVNSFCQKVVIVASYVCLASRGRQKWYSQDISFTCSKNAVKTILLRVHLFPFFSVKMRYSQDILFASLCIITHYHTNHFEVLRSIVAAKQWYSQDATSVSFKQNFLVVQVVTAGSYLCMKGTDP